MNNEIIKKLLDLEKRIEKLESTQVQQTYTDDELFNKAKELVIKNRKASTSYLQRSFSIGYARASRLTDELEEKGVIGGPNGSKPREVLIKK